MRYRENLTLSLAGNVMLGSTVDAALLRLGPTSVWGDALPYLRAADLTMVNLECALSQCNGEHGRPLCRLRSSPSNVTSLDAAGIDCVALANDHVCDCGTVGLLDTIGVLDAGGTRHAGAGRDIRAARRPALFALKGWRVAVLSFTNLADVQAASATSAGVNQVTLSTAAADFAPVRQAVAEARALADFVVFGMHAGAPLAAAPTVELQAFARAVIDAGAHAYWGHGSGVAQGIEIYHGQPILYDTGDLVNVRQIESEVRNDLSAVFTLHVRPPQVELIEMLPLRLHGHQVDVARGEAAREFVKRMRTRAHALGSTAVMRDDGRLVVEVPPFVPLPALAGLSSQIA
jgi:poly-gamma-glutamate synthesis protein (capsule biosynthesis protein)